ncbi:hypothetical protein A2U01_0114393, partial [Trifolium medium]|nr:hypothetical protein [Trifolium medium]
VAVAAITVATTQIAAVAV